MEVLTEPLNKRIIKEVKYVCTQGHTFFMDNIHIDFPQCPYCNYEAHAIKLSFNR